MELTFEEWCVEQHAQSNHFYDKQFNLPYKFHLTMAELVGLEFRYLLPMFYPFNTINAWAVWAEVVRPAIWGHDNIEDVGSSYNDIRKRSNSYVAEIIRAVTNDQRGRNRNERMPDYIYEEIVDTPFALFVKLCDRIANIRYSWMMQSRMFNVYKEEHAHFRKMLDRDPSLTPMWELLDDLLKPTLK